MKTLLPEDAKDPDTEYLSMFGMYEMEEAARLIVRLCRQFSPTKLAPWDPACYGDDQWLFNITELHLNQELLVGIAHLLAGGWLEASYPNSMFRATPQFIQKVTGHNQ